jgi:hypothetical protein
MHHSLAPERLSQVVTWPPPGLDVSSYVSQVAGVDGALAGFYSQAAQQSVLQSLAQGPAPPGGLQGVNIPHPMLGNGGMDVGDSQGAHSGVATGSAGDGDVDRAPTKKRGRPPMARGDEAKRVSSVQEKNRQAQARFRQRQKVRGSPVAPPNRSAVARACS